MPRGIVPSFLCAEAVLFPLFLTLDGMGRTEPGMWVKYMAILLCLTFSLFAARFGGEVTVVSALALTGLADVFLLLTDRWYAVGILLFLGAQGLHLYRLRPAGAPLRLPLRGALCLGLLLFLPPLGLASPLTLLACLYFSQLVVTAVTAGLCPGEGLLSAGLVLFVLCDTCVGLANTPHLFPALTGYARVGMWLFYLPAQVLIALSGIPNDERSVL